MSGSILEQINQQRLLDIEGAKKAVPLESIKTLANENRFPLVNFYQKLIQNARSNKMSVMAEVKRASPSKGDIAIGLDAAEQGLKYAKAGATAISCLTEPKWFKGTLADLQAIREAVSSFPEDKRPALLRKDFILDEYQIFEARYYGADTVLLIVASMQGDTQAKIKTISSLMACSRSLGMEPLVEVNNADEMKLALDVGAKVIGINNRNLHNFNVDLDTTTRLVSGAVQIPEDVIICALSGITGRNDVEYFATAGVKAVLVGETLMKAADPAAKLKELLGENEIRPPIVKICGVRDVPTAISAAESGANFLGLMFASESKRKISIERAKEIVEAIHAWRKRSRIVFEEFPSSLGKKAEFLTGAAEVLRSQTFPMVVGVFSNNQLVELNEIAAQVHFDVIQLSGDEGSDFTNGGVPSTIPILKAIHVGNNLSAGDILNKINEDHALASPQVVGVLLDTFDPSAKGGTGKSFDWNIVEELGKEVPFFLAGGLNLQNVESAVSLCRPFGLDVSSGVETEGEKEPTKIKEFIKLSKNVAKK